jgi:hypothetical protein
MAVVMAALAEQLMAALAVAVFQPQEQQLLVKATQEVLVLMTQIFYFVTQVVAVAQAQ